MTSRPIAVLGAGVATLAVTVLHAALAYRRNSVTNQTYADISSLTSTRKLLTSYRIFEINQDVPIDDVSPDLLSAEFASLAADLLEQATRRGVGLDWASIHMHVFDEPKFGVAKIIVRVNVL